jgi:hypothetical protein
VTDARQDDQDPEGDEDDEDDGESRQSELDAAYFGGEEPFTMREKLEAEARLKKLLKG